MKHTKPITRYLTTGNVFVLACCIFTIYRMYQAFTGQRSMLD